MSHLLLPRTQSRRQRGVLSHWCPGRCLAHYNAVNVQHMHCVGRHTHIPAPDNYISNPLTSRRRAHRTSASVGSPHTGVQAGAWHTKTLRMAITCFVGRHSHNPPQIPLTLLAKTPHMSAGTASQPASPLAAAHTEPAPAWGPLTLVSRPVPGVGPEMLQEPATDMAGVMSGPARPALAMVGVSPGSGGGRGSTHSSTARLA
jgi:hypothetical protein